MSMIIKTNLKNLGEGYCILTPTKILAAVEYVEWLDGEGDDLFAQATLSDDSTIQGAGQIELWVVWHEDVEKINPADLKNIPALDLSLNIG